MLEMNAAVAVVLSRPTTEHSSQTQPDTEAQHAHPKPTGTDVQNALQKQVARFAEARTYTPPYSKDRDPKTNPLWCYIPWCTCKKPFNSWSGCLKHVSEHHLCGSWAAIRDSDLCRLGKAELNVKEKERYHRNKSKAKAAGDAGVVTPAPKRQRGSTASNQPLGDVEGSYPSVIPAPPVPEAALVVRVEVVPGKV